jgi:hypothetical protein
LPKITRSFRHFIAPFLAIAICFDAIAQTQTIDGGCGANVGSVSGNVSINIDCGSRKTDQLSIQYVRLFGAAEVPLLMTLFGQPEISSGYPWGKKFRTILSPDGQENIVGTNVIQFFNRYSFSRARPLLTKLWSDVVSNDEAPSAILWLATAGSKAERICYFDMQQADDSGHYSDLLLEQKLIRK